MCSAAWPHAAGALNSFLAVCQAGVACLHPGMGTEWLPSGHRTPAATWLAAMKPGGGPVHDPGPRGRRAPRCGTVWTL